MGSSTEIADTLYNIENNYNDWLDYSYDEDTNMHSVLVETSDPALYTNEVKTYYVKVRLDDYYLHYPYNTVTYDMFTIDLKNCQVVDFQPGTSSDLTFGTNTDEEYNIYTPVHWIYVPEFISEVATADIGTYTQDDETCGYTLTYSTTWLDFYDT